MHAPEPGLYEAAFKRKSRRTFLGRPMPETAQSELEDLAEWIGQEEPCFRVAVCGQGAEDVFRGRIGYGMISGAVSYLAFIARRKDLETLVRIGYYGEWMVLDATRRGLATCWVAGTFNRAVAERQLALQPEETLVCVSPVGEAAPDKSWKEQAVSALSGSKRRKPVGMLLAGGQPEQLAPWQQTAMACVQPAPSAINLQPWRFQPMGDRMRIRMADGLRGSAEMVPVDCGIAMLHFAVGARHAGVTGLWTSAPDPYLGEFVPDVAPKGHMMKRDPDVAPNVPNDEA